MRLERIKLNPVDLPEISDFTFNIYKIHIYEGITGIAIEVNLNIQLIDKLIYENRKRVKYYVNTMWYHN